MHHYDYISHGPFAFFLHSFPQSSSLSSSPPLTQLVILSGYIHCLYRSDKWYQLGYVCSLPHFTLRYAHLRTHRLISYTEWSQSSRFLLFNLFTLYTHIWAHRSIKYLCRVICRISLYVFINGNWTVSFCQPTGHCPLGLLMTM